MRLLIPFTFFAILNLGTIILFKQKFGRALPVTLFCSALILYYSQMFFKTFKIGYWLLYTLAGISVILLFLHRKDPDLKSRIFSNGFYSYLIICPVILVLDYQRFFTTWDELSHWGKMVKEMIRLDRFYTEPASNLVTITCTRRKKDQNDL